jgi:hypothetical protein
MRKFLLTTLTFGLFLSPALAQEKTQEQLREEHARQFMRDGIEQHKYTRITPSGKDQRIYFVADQNPDCSFAGDITVRVTKQPEHGKVTAVIPKKTLAISAISTKLRVHSSSTNLRTTTSAEIP